VRCLKSILLFFFIASQVESVGQVFPVQSTVQLTPPYSLYLSDYAAPGSERLLVTAFLIDATRPELNVRFRLRIEGNGIKIETKPEFLPPPVALLGGVPLQLVSSDLAAYFDPRNLNFTGITQREYEQRGALPEGLYQFCFEVVEYNRGAKISNTGCAVAWLILNDPPIVNLPRDNEKIRIQDPQQVVFQWTPRHRGSPNSAFNAEYDFKLVEVWPSTRNPNDAILTSPVIFQTTTSETTLIYGPAETPLEPGRRYAFQIRARAYAGADEVSLFKNNGFSQVYTFVYGDACLAPQNISASDIGTTRFSVNFEGAPNHSSYSLRYRPIPNPQVPSSNWYTTTSLTPNLTINSLQPNTRYEFQVNAGCGTFTSDYSLVTNVTTKDNPGIQYSCGVPLTPFNLDPSQLINSLKVGDVIKAGDFDVVLSKVSGSNGTFSGEGVIEVSYFNQAKVKAEFTNVNVNNEMRMVNGYMNVTGAGVEVIPAGVMNLMDNLDEALAQADKALDEYEANLPQQFDENAAVTSTLITVPGTATVMPGSNGSVVIVDGSGKRTEVPAGTTASIVDSSGKGYIIDSKGKVHTTTAAIATAAAKREYNLKLKFAEAQDQKFGFDAKRYDPIASTYTKVEDQFLSWKSVATGNTDKALVLLEGAGIDKSKIRYELGGLELRPQDLGTQSPSPNAQSLELRGTADGLEEELIALYDPPSPNSQPPSPNSQVPTPKTQVLGKLSVITYDQIVKDLVIVPVNGNKYPYSEDALRTQLNKIYGQAVVKWNITFASNLDVPGIDPFDDGGSGLLSNYSPDMRKVVNAYKANVQRNTYYLFLVKNPKSTTLAGFMPRSKECGFIFVDKNGSEESIIRTMAHELGHGAFSLRHTFTEEKNTLPEKGTDNLMDYANGNKLFKYQWDRMRYPEIVMGLFEEDEEGALQGDPIALYILQKAKELNLTNKEVLAIMHCKACTENDELEKVEQINRGSVEFGGVRGNSFNFNAPGFKCLAILYNEAISKFSITATENSTPDPFRGPDRLKIYFVNGSELLCNDFIDNLDSFLDCGESGPVTVAHVNKLYEQITSCLTSPPTGNDIAVSAGVVIDQAELEKLQKLISDFKQRGIDSKVSIVSEAQFQQIQNTFTPEKEVHLLLGKTATGYQYKFYYKNNFFTYPTSKTLESGETISFSYQKSEVDQVRDAHISKAIADTDAIGELTKRPEATLNIFERGMWVIKVTKETLAQVKVPVPMWDRQQPKTYPFNLQSTVAGIGDGVVDEFKSIPDLLLMGLSLFDKQERDALITAVSSIDLQTLQAMFEEKAAKYTQGGDVAAHEGGYDAVQIASIFWGGALTKGKKATETTNAVKDVAKKYILDIPAPVGKFRQLIGKSGNTFRAADFWKKIDPNFKYFTSSDGKYLIKHDPATGRMLFVDAESKQFIGYAIDESNVIGSDYEGLLQKLKTVHGLPGGARSLSVRGTTINLPGDKANVLFGKYNPNGVPGIVGEVGTDDIINELGILKNYSFADNAFELKPGSVHVLNIPDAMANSADDFFDAYNKDFVDMVIRNKDKVNPVLVSDPRKGELLNLFRNNNFTGMPTGFAKEIKYLRDRGVKNVLLKDGTLINIENINLDNLNWTGWKY